MAPTPLRVLMTIYFYFVVSVFFLCAFLTQIAACVCLLPLMLTVKGFPRRALSSIFQIYMELAFIFLPFWRLKMLNQPPRNYRPRRTIIMCNHASGADPWVVTSVIFPWSTVFVIKESLCYVPIAGWSLWLAQYVRVKFTKEKGGWGTAPGAVKECMQQSADALDQGSSLMVFPEGTRSVTGRLQPFKDGFFRFALEHPDVEILPIAVHGTHKLWPVTSKLVDSGTVYAKYGQPIRAEGMTLETLKEKVHEEIFEGLRSSPEFDEQNEQPLTRLASHRGHGL
ncbi:acyltransferase domain-containing protein [Besnoitia besnoiti]|uniref:Acyltransferase domain-containing protein n=1 Tax=Besnoitia besnoiti TaxID=94643 RepID=A0A2A9ML04_BESBE|nr:acyltransferase domain-containing protein [Besnoitia besnoiti]PFH36363.1 acyltransferase domain-containing protein [Besnoitia besnoiti]